ncbi:MAG TPA: capsule assembly Wzi family protein [Longimicrobiaceae bacterium]|nr:capsule assembly Wzi family protein [Longimicrobiaceae bacterium]
MGAHGPVAALLLLLCACIAPAASAQSVPLEVRAEILPGSELESYLRLLQTVGEVPLHPWGVRGFSPAEVDRLLPADSVQHPWKSHYQLSRGESPPHLAWVRPRAQIYYNSAFPYGVNDGPVWAGRGLTTALSAGFAARYGPLSLTVIPTLFRAQNASFPLAPTGLEGRLRFADAWNPTFIDHPQRFGDGAYTRLDPGQSTLRLDAGGLALGVSTANQVWGPAMEFPLILGTNAPGFPHAFLGTAHPLDLWVGHLYGRMVWGRLDQSDYSPMTGVDSRRFMAGFAASFTPRGVPGLELGVTRFFHMGWGEEGPDADDFLKPLQTLFKGGIGGRGDNSDAANQLISVFGRWVFPHSGFEAYGEFAREDHNWDLRDFILEPDHDSAYLIGLRKAWLRGPDRMVAFRAELANGEISHLFRVREQAPFYRHSKLRQGHTQLGQILGSPAVYGGAGAVVGLDLYRPDGRWSLTWSRVVNGYGGAFWQAGITNLQAADVSQSLGAEALFFSGPFDVTAGLTGVYEMNRHLVTRNDQFNLNARLGLRWAW